MELTGLIRAVHAGNLGVYGARKVWHELRRQGYRAAGYTTGGSQHHLEVGYVRT
ncbi:transposase [Polymorphospora lycopeni]|uniref:transposase n=1 Tax=Polymorphospora TaxID=338583 RepID=UPI0035D50AFD